MDGENYFNEEEYFNEAYFEDEYLPQQIGCLPILLAVLGVALLMIFALNQVEITIPEKEVSAANLSDATGLGGGSIAPLFTPEVKYWADNIENWSKQTGIDANLIATVMQIESCGDPFAKSSAGAMGLFQVMPYHFENGEDPYKPATNALRGLDYLRRALDARGGVIRLGFAGYNGGITGAKRPESQWANETQRYVYWGTGIYADAVAGKVNSDRLNEWLNRGGASLCNQAAERLGTK
jgi:soluble lytic murein transglycosylase-like protein